MKTWVRALGAVLLVLLIGMAGAQPATASIAWKYALAEDTLAAAAIDTTVFDVSQMREVTLFVQYAGDSSKVSVQTSLDGVKWSAFLAATQCNGVTSTEAIQLALSLVTSNAAGSLHTAGAVGKLIRVIVNNDDKADSLIPLKLWISGERN